MITTQNLLQNFCFAIFINLKIYITKFAQFLSDPCIERGALSQTPKLYKYLPLTFPLQDTTKILSSLYFPLLQQVIYSAFFWPTDFCWWSFLEPAVIDRMVKVMRNLCFIWILSRDEETFPLPLLVLLAGWIVKMAYSGLTGEKPSFNMHGEFSEAWNFRDNEAKWDINDIQN